MGSKKKPVDRALPTSRKPTRTDVARIASARATTGTMKTSNLWALYPEIQAPANAWAAAADDLEENATVIADLQTKLSAARARQRSYRRTWDDARKHVFSTVAIVTRGSVDDVLQLGLDVRAHSVRRPLADAPTGLVATPSKVAGEVVMKWDVRKAGHGYMVQLATDPTEPATFLAPRATTKAQLRLKNGPATTYVRVAAIDPASPTGQSPYCDWVIASAPSAR